MKWAGELETKYFYKQYVLYNFHLSDCGKLVFSGKN